MKKVFLLITVLAAFAFNTRSYAGTASAIVGSWKVVAVNAPYEYEKSTLVVTETEKGLTAKLIFEGNQEVKVSNFGFSKDILKFTVEIDGESIQVTGKLENSKIAGSANTPDGEMTFSAVKGK